MPAPRARSPLWNVLDNAFVWNALRVTLDASFGLYRRRRQLLRGWGISEGSPSLLDVGCGIGQYASLTEGEYLGVDLTPRYIEYARRANTGHPNRGFRVADVETLSLEGLSFDLVLMVDFLHHIDDATCLRLLGAANTLARRHVISLEPVHEQDNPVGRWIIDHDRGDYMRSLDDYHGLFERAHLRVERSQPLSLGPIGTRAVLATAIRADEPPPVPLR
jgi:SAM-dependent methyltransferase